MEVGVTIVKYSGTNPIKIGKVLSSAFLITDIITVVHTFLCDSMYTILVYIYTVYIHIMSRYT